MLASQIVSGIIFLIMFIVIISDKWERHIPALIGGAIMIVVVFLGMLHSVDAVMETLNLASIFTPHFWYPGPGASESFMGINWTTIFFIAGMMVMVEGMAKSGFFRWLCLLVAEWVHYRIVPLLVVFMLMSGFLAMFIDSITVILFLAAVTVELARLLKFNPVPVILAEIFCANLGGAATMCGDPPNIIIGTSLGYSFHDFITNTGIVAWIAMIVSVFFFVAMFAKRIRAVEKQQDPHLRDNVPHPKTAITNMSLFVKSTAIFLLSVVLLITHATTGLSVASIGTLAAVLTLIASGSAKEAAHIMKLVDWKTLGFFVGLFIVVGGLEQTHVLEVVASYIEKISGGNLTAILLIVLWLSAICSAIVDNIPFAATMVPVIKNIALSTGLDLDSMAWALALGTDIGGNGTPIGASANVVGVSVAEKEGYKVTWGEYCKYAIPATVLVLVICSVYLVIRYC